MPVEILGETFLTEAEFAKELGCSTFSLARLRKKGEIGYQRLAGRRGLFYGQQHIAGCFAALAVPARSERSSGSNIPPSSDGTTASSGASLVATRPVERSAVTLSDMRRASEILGKAKHNSARMIAHDDLALAAVLAVWGCHAAGDCDVRQRNAPVCVVIAPFKH